MVAAICRDQPLFQQPADLSVTRGSLVLDGQGDLPFSREVVIVHPRRAAPGLALALLPFVASLAVLMARRWRKKED